MTQFVTPPTSTNIFFLLDRSGSMGSMATEAIGGVNAYIADQAKIPNTKFTLVQFDHELLKTYDNALIENVTPLNIETYIPRGMTALNDAVGSVLSESIISCPKTDTNILVILTDGQENASKKYSLANVKGMISEAQSAGWEVLFLGSNMEKETIVGSYGVNATNVSTFGNSQAEMSRAFNTVSASSSIYRGMKSHGISGSKVDVDAVYASTKSANFDQAAFIEAQIKAAKNIP